MAAVAEVQRLADRVIQNVGRVIIGKQEVLELLLVALLTEGHILLEDVPGTGKTTIAKTLARSLEMSFRRIQFTPDLLPSDVTGLYIFNQKLEDFVYRPGPLLANIVLADEINRATPRTQAALLEAMQERQITVEGETRALPRPFMVIATQNPVELEGTFPLPEAQLDRFLLRVHLGYPSVDEEDAMLLRFERQDPFVELGAVATIDEVVALRSTVQAVRVAESVRRYIVAIAHASREHQALDLGASPRASLSLYQTGQALAALRGRDFVTPDDIKYLAPFVMTHRVMISPQTRLRGRTPEAIITEVVGSVPAPVEAI